jgi:hypothetical protein
VTVSNSPLGDPLRDRYLLERELGAGGMATVLGQNTTQELVFLGPAMLAEARIQRALDRPREAARLYDAFVALWRECDPDSRSILDQAIAERTALSERT